MSALTVQPPAARDAASAARWFPALLAGVAGCLLLVVAASPPTGTAPPPFLDTPGFGGNGGPSNLQGWLYLVAPVAATALGLCLARWWPYLLVAAALMAVPGVLGEWSPNDNLPWVLGLLPTAGYPLAIIALLACAQGLIRTGVGWGAAIAALTLGSRLVGSAMSGGLSWENSLHTRATWHIVLLVVGFAGFAPAVWRYRRGDSSTAGPVGGGAQTPVRLIVVGTLAAALSIPLSLLTTQRLADLFGASAGTLLRHEFAATAAIGVITVAVVVGLAAVADIWSLAGAMTAAVAQAAVVAPALLAVFGLGGDDPLRWLTAAAGAALGAILAGSRWRIPLAAAFAVLAATALFIAYGATTGDPVKLAYQHAVIPSMLILVLCGAAAGAVVGATAPVLAPRGALPVVLGPLAGTLAVGCLQIVQVTYLNDGLPQPSILNPLSHLTTSAVLLLTAGAAISALGFAQQLATRRAERKQAEQIRSEAAAAERDRLARPIHDGVLQVLALVQRHGSELGGQGEELAALAGEQEVALRSLLTGGQSAGRGAAEDLRAALRALTSTAVEVATPAQPVTLPNDAVAEVVAAVRAALDNVRQHAGPGAHAWILLEDERDGVRVTVRDNGVGFRPERLAEAAEAGRLGIAQSMRGRIADRGGSTTIESRPGEGTEVEFWVPRVPPSRR